MTFKVFLLYINSVIINISDYKLMYLLFDWLELQFNSISIDKEIKNYISYDFCCLSKNAIRYRINFSIGLNKGSKTLILSLFRSDSKIITNTKRYFEKKFDVSQTQLQCVCEQ
jgi:hypothetical protein